MRRALVAGGNRGSGAAITRGLRAEGLDVVLAVRDLTAGRDLAEAMGARAVHCDLEAGVYPVEVEVEEVDVLVNNAGVLYNAPLFDAAARFRATLDALTVAAAREVGTGIKVNAMCPGWVRTRMDGDCAELTPEESADTAIWLATLPEGGPTGGLFRARERLSW